MSSSPFKAKGLPFLLSLFLILADQISKALVAAAIPAGHIGWTLWGDFFWLVHQKNLGVAFSIGYHWAPALRIAFFIILPTLVLIGVIVYIIKTEELTRFQHWAAAGMIGGGFGNLIDRVFRPDGVIDFASVKFYGLFGLERWPSFNVADASLLICGILLFISFVRSEYKAGKAGGGSNRE